MITPNVADMLLIADIDSVNWIIFELDFFRCNFLFIVLLSNSVVELDSHGTSVNWIFFGLDFVLCKAVFGWSSPDSMVSVSKEPSSH